MGGQMLVDEKMDMQQQQQQQQQGAASGTSPKSRNKHHHHQHHQQQQQMQQQQQHQAMANTNKFPGNQGGHPSNASSGAYPGPPSTIRTPFVSVRTGHPPPNQQNAVGMMGPSGSGGGNAPRYPTPIQRPTNSHGQQQQNPQAQMQQQQQGHSAGGPPGAPTTGLGARPRAPNPHPARIPGSGAAPGQPSKGAGSNSTSNAASTASSASNASAANASEKGSSPVVSVDTKVSVSEVGAAASDEKKVESAKAEAK